jgi:hypothetical protein
VQAIQEGAIEFAKLNTSEERRKIKYRLITRLPSALNALFDPTYDAVGAVTLTTVNAPPGMNGTAADASVF